MVEVRIDGSNAVSEVLASHKFWALKSRLEIPLKHIKRVYAEPDPAMGWFDGLKWAGTDVPHLFRAGTFWLDGKRVFFDVRHPENTIAIELEDERFNELWVEVANPPEAIELLSRSTRAPL